MASVLEELRPALAALEVGHPGDLGFESALDTVSDGLRRHVRVEENEDLPALAAVIGAAAMGELGRVYARIKEHTASGLEGMPAAERNRVFRAEC